MPVKVDVGPNSQVGIIAFANVRVQRRAKRLDHHPGGRYHLEKQKLLNKVVTLDRQLGCGVECERFVRLGLRLWITAVFASPAAAAPPRFETDIARFCETIVSSVMGPRCGRAVWTFARPPP